MESQGKNDVIDNNFLMLDRMEKIRSMDRVYSLRSKAFISFSGGKDSCVLSRLIDIALPGNEIPRVFFNTGLEYKQIRDFVLKMAEKDNRIVIVHSNKNVFDIWQNFGYPFKSKNHSHILNIYQNSGKTISVKKYLGEVGDNKKILCPKKLKYQFSPNFKLKVSDICCTKLKKQISQKFLKENNLSTVITGIRAEEGGNRLFSGKCVVMGDDGTLKKFNPLLIVSDDWCNWFIEQEKIELCELYKPPFNFYRTGCIGCPFAINLADELETLAKHDVRGFNIAVALWKPVYTEYFKIGYRGLHKIKKLREIFDD